MPFLQFGDTSFDAGDLSRRLIGAVRARTIRAPCLASFYAGEPSPEDGKQLSFRPM
jgi:hypothetical protein